MPDDPVFRIVVMVALIAIAIAQLLRIMVATDRPVPPPPAVFTPTKTINIDSGLPPYRFAIVSLGRQDFLQYSAEDFMPVDIIRSIRAEPDSVTIDAGDQYVFFGQRAVALAAFLASCTVSESALKRGVRD